MQRQLIWILAILLSTTLSLFAQEGTIAGKVTDETTGEILIGANVYLEGTSLGGATDADGLYSISRVPAGTYTLIVAYVGYTDAVLTQITVTADKRTTVNAALSSTGVSLNEITISASRRPEKVLDAPASVSVLDAAEIRSDVSPSSVSVLRNVTGVDVSQTGVDRREVVMRGFNNAFSGAAYVLTDYRQTAAPALAVNIQSIAPNMSIDLDRIEIVRGPGSALYGAGVDAGVIQYFTKNPFDFPGTAVSVGGGERSSFFGSFRQAGLLSEKVGYKVTGQYARADDWKLNPNDPLDAAQLSADASTFPDGSPITRNYDYEKYNLNGLLQFRLNDNTTLSANGGFSSITAVILSGIGTLQADGFGYAYGQARLQSGGFFAQAYLNRNDSGDSFPYGTGINTIDKGVQVNVQSQYEFDVSDKQNLIIGGDYEQVRPNTEGTIYGRNEDDDNISQIGGYVQSLTRLSSKLNLTVALRGDYDNIIEKLQVSPRVGLVVKPTPSSSVRATYNRAFSLPGNNSLFLDIVAGQTGPITIRGRGSKDGYTWRRNSDFAAFAGSDLIARSLNPATLGADTPIGLPLDAVYGQLYAGITATPIADLQTRLQGAGLDLSIPTIQLLVALLNPNPTDPNQPATSVQGFSKGALGIPSLTGGAPTFVNDLTDINSLTHTITQTFEVGYKGIIENKFLLAVDGYYTNKKDFVGPLTLETPLVFVPTLTADLTAAIASGIAGNETLVGALGLFNQTPESVAALLAGFGADQLPDPATPVAIVAPAENDLGVGAVPELMLAYRNFGDVSYWGIDATMQYLANENLRLFGNVSIVSDDFFNNEDLDETNTSLALALNAPKFKVKGGFSYDVPKGIAFGASSRYVQGFPVLSGPYIGGRPAPFNDNPVTLPGVDDFFLLDVNLGYDLYEVAPGLRVDVSVQNLLDNNHREFVGAPKIGRMAMARLNFAF